MTLNGGESIAMRFCSMKVLIVFILKREEKKERRTGEMTLCRPESAQTKAGNKEELDRMTKAAEMPWLEQCSFSIKYKNGDS